VASPGPDSGKPIESLGHRIVGHQTPSDRGEKIRAIEFRVRCELGNRLAGLPIAGPATRSATAVGMFDSDWENPSLPFRCHAVLIRDHERAFSFAVGPISVLTDFSINDVPAAGEAFSRTRRIGFGGSVPTEFELLEKNFHLENRSERG